MFHLKRLPWYLAWSVWLLLGFGLYRELPRGGGAQIRRIHLFDGEDVYGFWNRSHELIVRLTRSNEFRLVDVRNAKQRGPFVAEYPNTAAARGAFRREMDDDFNTLWQIWPMRELHISDAWKVRVVFEPVSNRRIQREWLFGSGYPYGFVSSDRQFWAYPDGRVFGPPTITWSVLALCQTILALPLALLWAVLRLRKKASPERQRREFGIARTLTADRNA